jgi:hypothetical protein
MLFKSDESGRFALEAERLGLALSMLGRESDHPDNGIRLFILAPGDHVNHSRGDHIGHCRTIGEVECFLEGFKHGLKKATLRHSSSDTPQ